VLIGARHGFIFDGDAPDRACVDIGDQRVRAVRFERNAVRPSRAVGRLMAIAGLAELSERANCAVRRNGDETTRQIADDNTPIGKDDPVLVRRRSMEATGIWLDNRLRYASAQPHSTFSGRSAGARPLPKANCRLRMR